MGFFKSIITDAEDCGYRGMSANETFEYLKKEYSHVDFSGEDFNMNGPVFEAYLNGRGDYFADFRHEEDERERSIFANVME